MNARDRWAAAGYEVLRLPSGFLVRGVRPASSEITRRKIFPHQLRQRVLEAAGKVANEKLSLEDDELQSVWVEQRRHLAALFLRDIWDDEQGEWEPLSLTAQELSEGAFDPADVEALDDLVYGHSPAAITARSEYWLGLIDLDEYEAIREREAGTTVDGWVDFRGLERSPANGAAGGDVAQAPVRAAGPNRAARRARGGRRAVAKADAVEGRA